STMCRSWRATRQRRDAPKGRAALMRSWLALLAAGGVNVAEQSQAPRGAFSWFVRLIHTIGRLAGCPDFSHEVKEAMDTCLACKACVGQCPLKIDIPAARSDFLELYHGRYLRSFATSAVASVEQLAPIAAQMPLFYN